MEATVRRPCVTCGLIVGVKELINSWLRLSFLWCKTSPRFFVPELPQAPRARSSSFHAGGSDSEESVNASSESLETEQSSQWHSDPREVHKERAATLPSRGFRTGTAKQTSSVHGHFISTQR